MKLLNKSLKWLMLPLLVIMSVWVFFLYFRIHSEIKASVDEGLDNYKRQVITQINSDSSLIYISSLDDGVFFFTPISVQNAYKYKDKYKDTLIYMQDADDLKPELEPVRMLSTAIEHSNKYYELKIVQPMVEQDDLIKQLSWNILGLFIVLLITILIANNLVLSRLWKPFYTLLDYIKSYRLGSGYHKFPDNINSNTREFEDLQLALDTLLKHNVAAYEQQKLFIGNASHELQTPLATTMNKLELLIEQGDLSDGQAQTIGEIYSLIDRLIKMNRSLLLLSKIDNLQYVDNQSVSINQIVKRSIDDIKDMADFKDISIAYVEDIEITVSMDVSLADVIVSNLMRNAVFHNHKGGSISINIYDNTLMVCNTGVDSSLDGDKVFDRFYKSDNSNKGSGLGLSIVKAICDLNNYSVQYEYSQSYHCFEVTFNHKK